LIKQQRLVALDTFTDAQIPLWNGTTDTVAFEHMLHLAREYYHTSKDFEACVRRSFGPFSALLAGTISSVGLMNAFTCTEHD
jgi:hypothetical protein